MLEIHQKINKQVCNKLKDTASVSKQEQYNRNEPPTSENRNATQPKNTEQTLI